MIKVVVFDFDGTLANTRELVLKIIKRHFGNFNYKVSKKVWATLGDDSLEGFISSSGIKKELVNLLAKLIKRDFLKEHKEITGCSNLKKIKRIKQRKIVVSNNTERFINESLGFLKVDFFDEVYGANNFKNKEHCLNKILRKYKLKPEEMVYVGDRPVDVRVAKKVGCFSVVVSNRCSWSNRENLLKEEPDVIVGDLGKLKRVVKKLNSL